MCSVDNTLLCGVCCSLVYFRRATTYDCNWFPDTYSQIALKSFLDQETSYL